MSRWHIPFTTRHPEDPGGFWEVGISRRKYDILVKNGDVRRAARLKLVEETLSDVVRICPGWTRHEKEDCFVYVGRPTRDYPKPGLDVPAAKGRLFLVFILPDGEIDDWNWRDCSENDPDLPKGVEGEP